MASRWSWLLESVPFRILKTIFAFALFVPCATTPAAGGATAQTTLLLALLGSRQITSIDSGMAAAGVALIYAFMCVADKYLAPVPWPWDGVHLGIKSSFKHAAARRQPRPRAPKGAVIKASFAARGFGMGRKGAG